VEGRAQEGRAGGGKEKREMTGGAVEFLASGSADVVTPLLHVDGHLAFLPRNAHYANFVTRATLCVKRVLVRASCPSGWLAVCHSRYCIKTETASVMISSPSDSPLI